jgi:hypothetical protein
MEPELCVIKQIERGECNMLVVRCTTDMEEALTMV